MPDLPPPSAPSPERERGVFLVHGRNSAVVVTLTAFLQRRGLHVFDFASVNASMKGSPFVGEVVREGLERAQAVLVLLTPDEYAELDSRFVLPRDTSGDTRRWQARPNVIFEGGLALGMSEDRAILVTVGADVSLWSDVSGRHVVNLSDGPAAVGTLLGKLRAAGCIFDEDRAPDSGDAPAFREHVAKSPFARLAHLAQVNWRSLLLLSVTLAGIIGVTALRAHRVLAIAPYIEAVGLVDIRSRASKETDLPPADFLRSARKEVFILGISASRTFDQHAALLDELLARGCAVRVLIMAPNSSSIGEISLREQKNVAKDVYNALERIKATRLLEKPGFSLRFYERPVPYTGIVIDGDIDGQGSTGNDREGQVRFQPMSVYKGFHDGIVLQLRNTGDPTDGYAFFLHDLRQQWKAAKERPELVANPH